MVINRSFFPKHERYEDEIHIMRCRERKRELRHEDSWWKPGKRMNQKKMRLSLSQGNSIEIRTWDYNFGSKNLMQLSSRDEGFVLNTMLAFQTLFYKVRL